MKTLTATLVACIVFSVAAQAEDLTFMARGSVSFISAAPNANTLGGQLANPVQIGDEVRFYYTFDSTTTGQVSSAGAQHLIYRAITHARFTVAGNDVQYVPTNNCNNQINVEDDSFRNGLYYDTYQVSPGNCAMRVQLTLSASSYQSPVPPLTSTALPLIPPKLSDFGWGSFHLLGGGHQIDVDQFALGYPDFEPPTVSGLFAAPNPVAVSGTVELAATVDDSSTGGSVIASSGYSVNGGPFSDMMAGDGSFDGTTESVTATLAVGDPPFNGVGVYEICVRGTDSAGYTSDPGSDPDNACTLVVAYDPSGGFVTGGGWIHSPAGACRHADLCADTVGKANFGFVSRYAKGAAIPTGNTEFQFSAAGLDFHSTAYDWLVVNKGSMNAQFKGSGTLNGALSPAGEAFTFMLWARDGGTSVSDTFRIKIWYLDAGSDVVVYDNGFDQPIGGGNIMVHVK